MRACICVAIQARLTQQSVGERNFHIFYSLAAAACGGTSPDGAPATMLPPEEYALLAGGGTTTVEGIDDATAFRETCEAMGTLGFGAETRAQVRPHAPSRRLGGATAGHHGLIGLHRKAQG